MRILHWSDSFQTSPNKGGSLDFINYLTGFQQKKGHEVAVVADSFPGCELIGPPEDIAVNRLPFTDTAFSSDLKAIKRITEAAGQIKRSFRPDIVHVHLNHTTALFDLLTKNSCAAPSVLTCHPPVDRTGFPTSLLKRIITSADRIVCVSKAQKSDADHVFEIGDKSYLIYNGIPDVDVQTAYLPFNPATVLCLGRLHETKGFAFALEACARVLETMPGSLKIIVAGDGPDGRRLRALASALGLKSNELEFRGWVERDDIPALINQCSMVLMPSTWKEPFGLVAAQAAQLGRPVIASNIGGIPEVVLHGKTGVLVPPGDAETIADAIKMLMNQPQLAIEMGAAAKKHAENSFKMERCAAEYEFLYNETIEGAIKEKNLA